MAFKRILIAIDRDETGIRATIAGLKLAAKNGAQVALTHVIQPTTADGSWFAVPPSEFSHASQGIPAEILKELEGQAPIPETVTLFAPTGPTVEAIVQVAKDWNADLVVVGSHGRGGVARALLGSVAEGVSKHAPCPVRIVRR